MSIVAIKGVPYSWPIKRLVLIVAQATRRKFEALNYEEGGKGPFRTAFVKVHHDPDDFIQVVNTVKIKAARLSACYPNEVPKLQPGGRKSIPVKTQKRLGMRIERNRGEVFRDTLTELSTELQMKYSGLYALSRSLENRLLREIGKIIRDRLTALKTANTNVLENSFKLSSAYRRRFPHFTDFQMVLSSLHKVEDELGRPRTQLSEEEFARAPEEILRLGDVPYSKVESICSRYAEKVKNKLKEHINNLSTDPEGTGDAQEKARIRVREELKKSAPYIVSMLRQVLNWDYHSKAKSVPEHHRMRLYGEPALPAKNSLDRFLRTIFAKHVRRCDYIYNMVYFVIPRSMYGAAIAKDGTTLDNRKLVVRCSEGTVFKNWTLGNSMTEITQKGSQ